MRKTVYRALVFERIAKGHSVTLCKAVSKKKSPTGKAIPAKKMHVVGCTLKNLTNKQMQIAASADDPWYLEQEITAMRKEGIIACTNGIWWKR